MQGPNDNVLNRVLNALRELGGDTFSINKANNTKYSK